MENGNFPWRENKKEKKKNINLYVENHVRQNGQSLSFSLN